MAKILKPKTRRGKFLFALTGVAAAFVFAVGCLAVCICAYGGRTSESSAQAAIVLGASVWSEEPCPVFKERINHAIVLYHAGKVQKLLFTGGLGEGSSIAESEAAKRYAITQGVPCRRHFHRSRIAYDL